MKQLNEAPLLLLLLLISDIILHEANTRPMLVSVCKLRNLTELDDSKQLLEKLAYVVISYSWPLACPKKG